RGIKGEGLHNRNPQNSAGIRLALVQSVTYTIFTMVKEYIFLAAGCVAVGIVITFVVLAIAQRLGINVIDEYMWVLAIPTVLSLFLNIALLELYRKYRKKK
ncbi:hypothetical protein ACFLVW_08025, partial [Chloroflexota bacterium]